VTVDPLLFRLYGILDLCMQQYQSVRTGDLLVKGTGIHWEEHDEDISVEGLLLGKSSGESQTSFNKMVIKPSSPVSMTESHDQNRE
jgi:hypothetical protein